MTIKDVARLSEVSVATVTRVLQGHPTDDRVYPGTLSAMADHADRLGLDTLITHVLPLEDAARGIDLLARGEAMKVLLEP